MKRRTFAIASWCAAGAVALTFTVVSAAGLRYNTTVSAPRGVWRIAHVGPQQIARGMMVSVCPPAERVVQAMRDKGYLGPGDCPGTRTEPLLKPVVAVAGDTVTVRPGKPLAVNGEALPNSTANANMPAWPSGSYRVKPGHVWLVSSYDPNSFDSRYFGPVAVSSIRGQAVPVLIRGDAKALTLHPILHLAEGRE